MKFQAVLILIAALIASVINATKASAEIIINHSVDYTHTDPAAEWEGRPSKIDDDIIAPEFRHGTLSKFNTLKPEIEKRLQPHEQVFRGLNFEVAVNQSIYPGDPARVVTTIVKVSLSSGSAYSIMIDQNVEGTKLVDLIAETTLKLAVSHFSTIDINTNNSRYTNNTNYNYDRHIEPDVDAGHDLLVQGKPKISGEFQRGNLSDLADSGVQ